jgi:hypothetical protein
MIARRCLKSSAVAALTTAAVLAVFAAPKPASAADKCISAVAPSPSASPSASSYASPSESSSAPATATTALAAPTATPTPEPPLYAVGQEIYTVDRDATYFYYFQANRDGSAKVKNEIRLDRNLWDTCAQLQIRLPFITRYPNAPSSFSPEANPFFGFGNLELRYSYNVAAPKFDHTLELGIALPTEVNGVESQDTQLKAFYTTKWKFKGWSIAYLNEFDQTVIRPPGASYTSYYEGKLTLPTYSLPIFPKRGLKVSAIYNYRWVFDSGGIYRSAAGALLTGTFNDVAFSVYDTWGVGANGLWKYKLEASLVGRF